MTNTITTNSDELAYAPAHELAARIRRRMHGRGEDSQTLITEAPTSFVNASRSGPAARHR
jgi:hypothetical protein